MRERVQAPDIQTAVAARTAIGERPTVLVLDADLIRRGPLQRRRARKLVRAAHELNTPLVVQTSRPRDLRSLPFIPSLVLSGQPDAGYDDLAIQSHVAHFRSAQTESPSLPLPSIQYVFNAWPTDREVLRVQEPKPTTVFPIEQNPLKAALHSLRMTNIEKPGMPHANQTNWARKFEWAYGWAVDRLNDPNKTPSDITMDGMKAIQRATDKVVNASGTLSSKELLSVMKELWLGWGRDLADGIRARRRKSTSKDGAILDLAVDRTQEIYMTVMISLLNFTHMDKTDPNARTRLINGLLTATATILPTIANAQDAMLGVVAPEKSPEGGSRRDRVQLVSRALSYAARGKYEKARRNIDKMRNQVTKAFTFRSTPTELFRTDTNDPTSFEINRLNPKDFKSKELQSPRDNAAKWMQFVWFTQETVKFVIEKLKEQGLSSLVGQYEAAVNEQLGSYATVPVHDIVAKWNAALGEGTFTINKTLSPQALLGLPKNHQEPVLL